MSDDKAKAEQFYNEFMVGAIRLFGDNFGPMFLRAKELDPLPGETIYSNPNDDPVIIMAREINKIDSQHKSG